MPSPAETTHETVPSLLSLSLSLPAVTPPSSQCTNVMSLCTCLWYSVVRPNSSPFLSTWFLLSDLSIILHLRFLLMMSPKISFIYHLSTGLLGILFCSPHPSLILLVSSGNKLPNICKVCHLGSCRSCRYLEYSNKLSCWQVQDMHTCTHSPCTHTTLQYITLHHTLTRTIHTLTCMYTHIHTHAHAGDHHVPQASYHGNYSQVIT